MIYKCIYSYVYIYDVQENKAISMRLFISLYSTKVDHSRMKFYNIKGDFSFRHLEINKQSDLV